MTKKDFDPASMGQREKNESATQSCGSGSKNAGYSWAGGDYFSSFADKLSSTAHSERTHCSALPYDMYEKEGQLVIELPLPGLIRETLHVSQEMRSLHIRGENQLAQQGEEHRVFLIRQIQRGVFDQVVILPYEVDIQKTKAAFVCGVLIVRMVRQLPKNVHMIPVTFE